MNYPRKLVGTPQYGPENNRIAPDLIPALWVHICGVFAQVSSITNDFWMSNSASRMPIPARKTLGETRLIYSTLRKSRNVICKGIYISESDGIHPDHWNPGWRLLTFWWHCKDSISITAKHSLLELRRCIVKALQSSMKLADQFCLWSIRQICAHLIPGLENPLTLRLGRSRWF